MMEEIIKLWHSVGAYNTLGAKTSWTRVKSQIESETLLADADGSEARVLLHD